MSFLSLRPIAHPTHRCFTAPSCSHDAVMTVRLMFRGRSGLLGAYAIMMGGPGACRCLAELALFRGGGGLPTRSITASWPEQGCISPRIAPLAQAPTIQNASVITNVQAEIDLDLQG